MDALPVSRRTFIATLGAALVAPRLSMPVEPTFSIWSSKIAPATGVLTLEILQQAIDNITQSIGRVHPMVFPPWYIDQVNRIETNLSRQRFLSVSYDTPHTR